MSTWIQSFTGRKVTPLDLKPEQVCLADVAHALALKCRFNGHCREFYSVAQHCVLGALLMPTPELALAFLLHEVDEVYLPDVGSPIVPHLFVSGGASSLTSWRALRREHARVVLKALGLEALEPLIHGPEVKWVDLEMLAAEKRDLMTLGPANWPDLPPCDRVPPILPWEPTRAEFKWVAAFDEATARGCP